jgi:hypothetical protein
MDTFVEVGKSMWGGSGTHLNLGDKPFKIITYAGLLKPCREMSHSSHVLFHSSLKFTHLYTNNAADRAR